MVAFAHLRQRAHTKFKGIRRTGIQVNHLLIKLRLINQPRLAPHRRHRRIIGMQGEFDTGFLGHGKNFTTENAPAAARVRHA